MIIRKSIMIHFFCHELARLTQNLEHTEYRGYNTASKTNSFGVLVNDSST